MPLTAENLRRVTTDEVLRTMEITPFRSSANVDGWVLEDDVHDVFAAGRQHDLPVIAGWTADEGATLTTAPAGLEAYRVRIRETYGPLAGDVLARYAATSDGDARTLFFRSYADAQFGYSVRTWIRLMEPLQSNAYLYHFTRVPPPDPESLGAYHSVDVAYVFGNLVRGRYGLTARDYDDVDRRLSDMVMSYWVNFAATGDPNGPGLPTWPPHATATDMTMVFGGTAEARAGVRTAELDVFDRHEARRRAEFEGKR